MSFIHEEMKLGGLFLRKAAGGCMRRLQEDAGENCKKMQRICRNVAEKFSGLAPRFGG